MDKEYFINFNDKKAIKVIKRLGSSDGELYLYVRTEIYDNNKDTDIYFAKIVYEKPKWILGDTPFRSWKYRVDKEEKRLIKLAKKRMMKLNEVEELFL